MCSRFVVHNVDVAELIPEERLKSHSNIVQSWENCTENKQRFTVEKSSIVEGRIVHHFLMRNCLAEAVHISFFNHYPLRLTADVIWTTLLQGLAIHMQTAAEEERSKFVAFEGKKDLAVVRPDIILGRDDNDWADVISDFTMLIRDNIRPSNHFLIDCNFSTTTYEDTIARSVAVMDITRHFFRLGLYGGCGIPWIELMGVPEDWELLRARAAELGQYGLDWWMPSLLPVLDRFVRAAHGDVDEAFFRAAVFRRGGSGSTLDPCTGWIQALFPYVSSIKPGDYTRNFRVNAWADDTLCDAVPKQKPTGYSNGMQLHEFPTGVNNVPFKYKSLITGEETDLRFGGGLVAVVQNEVDGALEVKSGWAILRPVPSDVGEIVQKVGV